MALGQKCGERACGRSLFEPHGKSGFDGFACRLDRCPESPRHTDRIAGGGDRRIYEHGIGADVERIEVQQVNEAWERVVASDVKYRFVIDTASLRA